MIAMIVAIKGSCAWVGSTYAILSVEAMMVLCGSVYPYVVTINSGAFACVSKKCRGESLGSRDPRCPTSRYILPQCCDQRCCRNEEGQAPPVYTYLNIGRSPDTTGNPLCEYRV